MENKYFAALDDFYQKWERAKCFGDGDIIELLSLLKYRKDGARAIQDSEGGKAWLAMINEKIKHLLML